jgi:hypothetical protein
LLSAGRSGLREAIVLSEILGAPVGLRPGIEPWEER